MSKKTVTGFKAFDANLRCKDFQYKVGESYEHKGAVIICNSGFHFCEYPLAVLDYYPLIGSRFAEVETDDVRAVDGDKSVAGKISIKKEITFGEMIKAQVALVFSFCFTKSGAPKTDSNVSASSQKYAQLASSGDGAKLASSGDGAKLASSGDGAKLASSGYGAQLASSGYGAQLASSGYGAQLASSGDGAKLASSGYGAKLEASGNNSIVAGIGFKNSASGALGSWIVLAEWEYDNKKEKWVPSCVRSEQVDGKKIKAGVLYRLENGKFVEDK